MKYHRTRLSLLLEMRDLVDTTLPTLDLGDGNLARLLEKLRKELDSTFKTAGLGDR